MYIVPQLVWHLVKFCNSALKDGEFWNEALRHELLVLLRVEHLLSFVGLCASCRYLH